MKALKFDELTLDQKLGLVSFGYVLKDSDWEGFEENLNYILDAIKNHKIGCLWMSWNTKSFDYAMKKIKEVADYPLLIFTDAIGGIGDYLSGGNNSIGMANSEENAYTYGKVVGLEAKRLGYTCVCNPIVDKSGEKGRNPKGFSNDKYKITRLAEAMARGMHDAGILTIGKHYPSVPIADVGGDSHMGATYNYLPKNVILDDYMYPYFELSKKGLIDGILVNHRIIPSIDPDFPSSLSQKVVDIIKDAGFDGFLISDCLHMMGILSIYNKVDPKGMTIEAGLHAAMGWEWSKETYDSMGDCYNRGIVSEKRIDEAVKKIIEAQEKLISMEAKYTEITDEDKENYAKIDKDAVAIIKDDNITDSIDKDGKHLFVLMVENGSSIADDGKVTLDTFSTKWYNPNKVTDRIKELFPNSAVRYIDQFPTPYSNSKTLHAALDYDDVIFLTYAERKAFVGTDRFTSRVLAMFQALQKSNSISTLIHFGTGAVLEDITVHIPRIVIGGQSPTVVDAALEVLAGNYPAKGEYQYKLDLK